uniref:Uncharacterized protein n=1 Tax=Anguilla anguilla TaxID=7936 RepID=A0A0E9TQB5_ANGAN
MFFQFAVYFCCLFAFYY